MVSFSIFELSQMNLTELLAVAKADPSNRSNAMNEVVRRHQAEAKFIAIRVCFNDNDRGDVMNAALMGVVKAVRAHDGRQAGFKSYLRTTMLGEARRMSVWLGDQVLISECDAFDEAVVRESKMVPSIVDNYDPEPYGGLTIAVGHLSDNQQVVVNDLYRNELTQAEIAARHAVTVSAISQRLKTIHRHLAADLAA
jgi:RNA polymerase sigma-B factor